MNDGAILSDTVLNTRPLSPAPLHDAPVNTACGHKALLMSTVHHKEAACPCCHAAPRSCRAMEEYSAGLSTSGTTVFDPGSRSTLGYTLSNTMTVALSLPADDAVLCCDVDRDVPLRIASSIVSHCALVIVTSYAAEMTWNDGGPGRWNCSESDNDTALAASLLFLPTVSVAIRSASSCNAMMADERTPSVLHVTTIPILGGLIIIIKIMVLIMAMMNDQKMTVMLLCARL